MSIRKIAQLGEPILRRVAEPFAKRELRSAEFQSLLDDLIETMRDADGAGLAAPQIYVSRQLCAIEVQANPRYPAFPQIPLTVLVNPRLTPLESAGTIAMYEGCLSVGGMRGRVTRPRSVRVQALRPDGDEIDEIWEGIAAAIVQHEVDHLQGHLYVDHVDPSTLCFLREYERHVPLEARIVDGGPPQ